MQRTFALACAALLALAVYWAVRLARADFLARQSSPTQLAAALRLAPANADYWQRWADLADETGQPVGDAYEHAAILDPYNSSFWIRTGLRAEAARNYALAERDLLQAARIDRLYEPRWTLANFYFRRGDSRHFWPWAKSALQRAYGDRRPLFDLCWRMISDPAFLLRNVIPDSPEIRREYLAYLLELNRLDAADAVAANLADVADPSDRGPLLNYADRMLAAQRWDAALSVWNKLCQRGIIPYAALDPANGRSLTNSDFRLDPLAAGFDWRLSDIDGIIPFRSTSPPALRFTFSGNEPERCDLLQQSVPVLPGAPYRLSFDYRTSANHPQTGLQWKLFHAATGAPVPAISPQLSSPDWQTSAVSFRVPPDIRELRLVLNYQRLTGTVRIEGEVWLRNLRLETLR